MAESPKDIVSGFHRLKFRLGSEKEASLDRKLRDFAFKLALIEKAASTLGTMNFVWATVVLLGSFSQSLKSIDFWFVSVILVVEGLRILCRRGELATRRSWSPDSKLIFIINLYSLMIQELSAIACIVLSSLRIHKQQYGSDDNLNRNRALNLFYWLSIVESSLTLFGFLVRVNIAATAFYKSDPEIPPYCGKRFFSFVFDCYTNLILFVIGVGQSWDGTLVDYGFDNSQISMVLRYFYDTYRRCINGSVFDGLKTDFVSYSVELLLSIDDNEQLEGARLLSMLLKSDLLSSEKLRVIGTTPGALEKLIEFLSWEEPEEQEIRRLAGEIICKLVKIRRNRVRLMAIPESIESITCLLYESNQIEIHSKLYQGQSPDEYIYSAFSLLGKQILKILVNDPDYRVKIGTNKGLLRKIIELEKLNPIASESEIIRHLESLPMETLAGLAGQQDVRENISGTSRFEIEHSVDSNSQSFDSQV